MDPPIIARDTDGCLGVFDTVEDIRSNLDIDDVEAGEYVVFDSQGSLLVLILTRDPAKGAERPGYTATITVQPVEETPRHANELRDALVTALGRSGLTPCVAGAMSLSELVQAALERRKGVWLP